MFNSKSDRPYTGNTRSDSTDQLCPTSDSESLYLEPNGLFSETSSGNVGPSEFSFIRQLSQLHEYSAGRLDFIIKTTESLYSEVWVKCLLLVAAVVPIAMLVVGTSYRSSCPEIHMLPVYLTVGGAVGLVKIAFILLRHRGSPDYEQIEYQQDGTMEGDAVLSRFIRFTDFGMNIFLLIWFILGNYWFFSNPTPDFKQTLSDPNNWCDGVLYKFFFIMLVVDFVLFGLIIMYVTCLVCFYHRQFIRKICNRFCS